MQPLEDKKDIDRMIDRREIGSQGDGCAMRRIWEIECRRTVKLDSMAKILDSKYDINE